MGLKSRLSLPFFPPYPSLRQTDTHTAYLKSKKSGLRLNLKPPLVYSTSLSYQKIGFQISAYRYMYNYLRALIMYLYTDYV